ncbi:MAG: NosD domain-containing protein [Halobacteriales archaeon]|nr:NosD domain-containing protein [Halobacteriales archaeon]
MFTERRLRTSVVLLGVLFVVGMVATGSVAAQEPVSECRVLDTPNETYQLNDDIENQTEERCLEITANGVTLDGAGHTVDGMNQTPNSLGISFNGMDNVVVKNFGNITGWDIGVGGDFSTNATLTDNTANNNGRNGFRLIVAESTLAGNTANNNEDDGFALGISFENVLTDNTANNNEDGIALDSSRNNELTGNTANGNEQTGIELDIRSVGNTLTDNTANDNDVGILVEEGSNDNELTGNEANENTWGIIVLLSEGNEVVDNVANRNDGETGSEQPLPPIISDFPGIGVKIAGSFDTTVEDNEANQNRFTGISVLDSGATDVNNNDVHENGVGEGGFAGQFGSGIGVFRVGFFGDTPSEPEELAVLSSHTSPNRITDNDATGNQVGITLLGATNNTLSDNTATENFIGIQSFGAFNNTFTNDTSRDNIEFDYIDTTGLFFFGDALEPAESLEPNNIESPGISDLNKVENLNIGNSEKPNTEISFKTVNFALRGTSAQPPANPNAEATGRYFEALPIGGPIGDVSVESIEPQQHELPDVLLDIDLHYKNADVNGINESSLGLWAFDTFESGWLELSDIDEPGFQDTEVDEQNNVVSWNFTLGTAPLSQNELTPQAEGAGEVSPTQIPLPVFGAFGEGVDCVNRRNLGRGQEASECPFDRDVQRGGSREELDRSTGRGGEGDHRDSATERRNRSR